MTTWRMKRGWGRSHAGTPVTSIKRNYKAKGIETKGEKKENQVGPLMNQRIRGGCSNPGRMVFIG